MAHNHAGRQLHCEWRRKGLKEAELHPNGSAGGGEWALAGVSRAWARRRRAKRVPIYTWFAPIYTWLSPYIAPHPSVGRQTALPNPRCSCSLVNCVHSLTLHARQHSAPPNSYSRMPAHLYALTSDMTSVLTRVLTSVLTGTAGLGSFQRTASGGSVGVGLGEGGGDDRCAGEHINKLLHTLPA
jgi:hypothetical protein